MWRKTESEGVRVRESERETVMKGNRDMREGELEPQRQQCSLEIVSCKLGTRGRGWVGGGERLCLVAMKHLIFVEQRGAIF